VELVLTQLRSAGGVRVIGTTSTDDKAALAREAGAAEVIRYDREDVAREVSRITEGAGVDVFYDGVGRATCEGSLDSLRPRGMFVLYGAASGPVASVAAHVLQYTGSMFFTQQ